MSIRSYLTYVSPESIVGRLSPPTKIFLPVIVSFMALATTNFYLNLFLLLAILVALFALAKPPSAYVKLFTGAAVWMCFVFAIFYLFLSGYKGNVIFQLGPVSIVDTSVYMVASIILRFLTMTYATVLLLCTTNQKDIVMTVRWLRLPYAFSFMLALAFRCAIMFLEDSTKVQEAQRGRAVEFNKGSLIRRLRKFIALLVPLIVISLKRTQTISNAIESRAFSFSTKKRTFYFTLQVKPVDYIIIGTLFALFALLVVSKLTLGVFMGYPI